MKREVLDIVQATTDQWKYSTFFQTFSVEDLQEALDYLDAEGRKLTENRRFAIRSEIERRKKMARFICRTSIKKAAHCISTMTTIFSVRIAALRWRETFILIPSQQACAMNSIRLSKDRCPSCVGCITMLRRVPPSRLMR